jgi:cell division protease FtsH
MVTRYGMSALGPINLEKSEEMVFLGRDMGERTSYSEETNRKVDEEVKKILDDAYAQALAILTNNRAKLDQVVDKLMEQETLEGDEFEALMVAK